MRYLCAILLFSLVFVSNSHAAGADNLVNRVAKNSEISAEQAKASIALVFQALGEELSAGNEVGIRNFGTFYLNHREARTARNPRTGEAVDVPAKAYPRFRASKNLKSNVNNS